MQTITLIVLILGTVLNAGLGIYKSQAKNPSSDTSVPEKSLPKKKHTPPIEPPAVEPEGTPEPQFEVFPAVRKVNSRLGKVLGDIDSHLPAGHIYADSDLVTHGHETSHGIASALRMKFSNPEIVKLLRRRFVEVAPGGRINGFYCLEDRACIIVEPKVTIKEVAKIVPSSLRGDVYDLYLIRQAESWNDTPLYILDEFIAYMNGSAVRQDLKIADRSETVQYTMEFMVYSTCLAKVIQEGDPNYDDRQFKAFLMWNIERGMTYYSQEEGATEYLEKFRTNSDAQQLRQFAQEYFGSAWCQTVFKF